MSEELKAALARIACLEGEIAKRDEELAAGRVAVENCDLFRARIAELEQDLAYFPSTVRSLAETVTEREAEINQLRAELATIKEQEPIGWYTEDHLDDKSATTYSWTVAERWVEKGWPVSPLYAAPVSEAKAKGVVMPEGWIPLTIEHEPGYPEDVAFGPKRMMDRLKKWLDRYFEMRLNTAPAQQVSVPDEPTEAMRKAAQDKLASEGLIVTDWLIHTAYSAMLNAAPVSAGDDEFCDGNCTWLDHHPSCARAAAPAAPAADAWIPVSERLPGDQGHDSEEVLCFLNGHCSRLDNECRQGGGWGIRLGYYDADIGTFRVFGRPKSHVTHWMPLPAAPIKIEANRHDQ